MSSVFDSLHTWARRACATARRAAAGEAAADRAGTDAQDPVVYRLRAWPELPQHQRTARVLRLLSTMSVRPVNRRWMLWQSQLAPQALDALLQHLAEAQALQVMQLPVARSAAPMAATAQYTS